MPLQYFTDSGTAARYNARHFPPVKAIAMTDQRLLSALAACALAMPAAQAQIAVTADLGTTGPGLHLVVPMESYLNGRFGINHYARDKNDTANGIAYQLKATLRTVDILFDWFPSASSALRLTAGVVYNGSRLAGTGVAGADGKFTINGKSYDAATVGTLNGEVEFRRAAPYLGIGWGNPLAGNAARGWQVGGDLGAFYQGRPSPSLISHGCTVSSAVCTQLARDVTAEQARFGEEISNFKVYPVLRASIAYRF